MISFWPTSPSNLPHAQLRPLFIASSSVVRSLPSRPAAQVSQPFLGSWLFILPRAAGGSTDLLRVEISGTRNEADDVEFMVTTYD
jgi:hypothetical protein